MLNPSRYRIIAIGKVRKRWIQNGIELYLKRLPGLAITELRNGDPKKETKAIRSSIKSTEKLIVLTEEGERLTSHGFSGRLQKMTANRLVFLIGSANGLTPDIKEMAYCHISLSPLTFPHELARLLLIEQIYRAVTISENGPYHKA